MLPGHGHHAHVQSSGPGDRYLSVSAPGDDSVRRTAGHARSSTALGMLPSHPLLKRYGHRMAAQGQLADDRTLNLPADWEPLERAVLKIAFERAKDALGIDLPNSSAVQRLAQYYDPTNDYSGSLFLSVEPNHATQVGAADLWAVSTLSMRVPPLTGRLLLTEGPTKATVTRCLHRLSPHLTITEVNAEVLDTMWTLHDTFRTVMSSDHRDSNWWVFAAKMSARKRPLLFPVRDSLVCTYLSGGMGLGTKPGQLGRFPRDIQVFAYLMSSPVITRGLEHLRRSLTAMGTQPDWSDLRLLDVALWTAATSGVTMSTPHE